VWCLLHPAVGGVIIQRVEGESEKPPNLWGGDMGELGRDFTLRQLRTFICAARMGNFTDAAAELGISQPAVSDQITLLEGRLGHRLFRRRRGTTPVLTIEGVELLEKAEELVQTSEAMRREDDGQRSQRVRISIGPWLRDHYLKPLLPRIYREHAGLALEVTPVIPRLDIHSAMERGRVDLVVYTVGQLIEGWPNAKVVAEVETAIVGRSGIRRRLESGAEVIEDLQFILPATGNFGEHWQERQLQALGIKLRKPIVYIEFPDVIQQMVEDGQGVTMLMTEQQVARSIFEGKLETFGPRLPSMKRVIARSKHAPSAAEFVERHLSAAFTRPPMFGAAV